MGYLRSPNRLMSLEEYLAFEEQSPLRHEFIAGEVFAMSGATTRHNLIVLNIAQTFRAVARAHGCRVFAEAVKLRAAVDRVYYPDVVVACGPAAEVELIVEEPSVVVEVTSPATRGTDRREKLDAYQRIPSLRMYLIVEQRWRKLIAYQRDATGEWLRVELEGEGEIVVPPMQVRLTLDQIYDDVPMPPIGVREGEEWDEGGEED
ncbi:MAG: Uma2 family endonuclease [Gemmatimonadetes bacterium]|nr:Uma2 family endonuclease [Gemmatimonadota bacterium]MBI2403233.1 Uma2 family endonuclease [Gemmatimonadota bacterium]MBI2535936.1 Uma2 family endonuclease [Gemmatimonadota bacterium]